MRKKREKLIKEHLKSMEALKKRLPKAYWPIEDITEIHYGSFGRKTITVEEIITYKKQNLLWVYFEV